MSAPPEPRAGIEMPGLSLEPVIAPTMEWYRSIYSMVGEDWLWYTRVVMNDDQLTAILNDDKVEVFALKSNGIDAGLLELDLRDFSRYRTGIFWSRARVCWRRCGALVDEQSAATGLGRTIQNASGCTPVPMTIRRPCPSISAPDLRPINARSTLTTTRASAEKSQ